MQTFAVHIFTHEADLFQGEVESISSHNSKGPFDILDNHSNFISIIDTELIVRTPSGEEKRWSLESGVLRCLDTNVSIYLAGT